MTLTGGCHCGNLSLTWEVLELPGSLRACDCDYCVGHDAAYASDPDSTFTLTIRDATRHRVVRHGTGTAAFHECADCEAFVCVTWDDGDERYGVVNTCCLDEIDPQAVTQPACYAGETSEERLARRRRNWCRPVKLSVAEPLDCDACAAAYRRHRVPDARIGQHIWRQFEPGWSVANIGAGTGAYEPDDIVTVAIEPSAGMIQQRRPGLALALQAVAEALPLADDAVDATMALLTLHHWRDYRAGLRELRRVSRHRVVLFTWVGYRDNFWLVDYLPQIRDQDELMFPSLGAIAEALGVPVREEVVPLPADCTDGFMCAYWARPEAYLQTSVRLAISSFAHMGYISGPLPRLQRDIESGEWRLRYGHLLDAPVQDMGYRLVTADID